MNYNLLFPGAFKPFHDGHLFILLSYILNNDNININNVYIIISPKDRDSITAETTLWFLNKIKNKLNNLYSCNIIPIISDYPSPILKCYKIVNNDIGNNLYCLVSSNKDTDIERQKFFISAYLKNGKYYNDKKGEQTYNIHANITPAKYYNRTDNFNNNFISATIVRNDIKNNDFNLFKTSYNYMLRNNIISNSLLYTYFLKLKKCYL